MRSWIIKGVPLTIQIINFVKRLNGLNFDIAPKAIKSPRGSAPIKVTANNFRVCKKPAFNAGMTMGICSRIISISCISYLPFLLYVFFVFQIHILHTLKERAESRPLCNSINSNDVCLPTVIQVLHLRRRLLHIPAWCLLHKLLQNMHSALLPDQNLHGNQHRILHC